MTKRHDHIGLAFLAVIAALSLTACATTAPVALDIATTDTVSSAPVAIAPAPVAPLQRLADGIDALAKHPLFALVQKDAADTLAWVDSADGPTEPLLKFRARQCPLAIQLAAADFQAKAAGFAAQLQAIDAKVKGLESAGAPELILFNTKLRYGRGPAVDPRAQLQQIKDDVAERVTAVVDSCRGTIPIKQLDDAVQIAKRAGLAVGTGGVGLPALGLLP